MFMKTYLIIDSLNLMYQCAYAKGYSWMKTKDGRPTGHIFGSLRKIFSIIKDLREDVNLIFAFDTYPKETYKIYPEYKANRVKKDGSLLDDFMVMVSNLPCMIAYGNNVEADSIIYTLTKRLSVKGRILILSMDRDLWPLYKDATILREGGGEVTQIEVKTKFGIRDGTKIPLWKSVFGDASDNIPSVKRLRKCEIIPLIDKSDGTPANLLSLAAEACKIKSTKSLEVLIAAKKQIEQMFRVVQLKEVKVKLYQQSGNQDIFLSFLHSLDIKSLDEKLPLLF